MCKGREKLRRLKMRRVPRRWSRSREREKERKRKREREDANADDGMKMGVK